MPHLTIDYSVHLGSAFDHAALIRELHSLVLEESGSVGVCKTFMRPAETYVGDSEAGTGAFMHVEIGLKPGRAEALKALLAERVLAVVGRHLRPGPAQDVVLSAEVRELAGSYRLAGDAEVGAGAGQAMPACGSPLSGRR
jgi:5-carboxymethyl-2-hydroxymuconate isomerase